MAHWIANSTVEGATVLDPFCGSGTTCAAAKGIGRNFIGIEINPEYARIARGRVS
jgi:DNA modification methylase